MSLNETLNFVERLRTSGEPILPGILLNHKHIPEPTIPPQKLRIPTVIPYPPVTSVERLVSGEYFNDYDQELTDGRAFAQILLLTYNNSSPLQTALRRDTLKALLGTVGSGLSIRPPFHCNFGSNIHVGDRVFFNYNCTILDDAPVVIGSDCLLAPNVGIYTAAHPIDHEIRPLFSSYALPIVIGPRCWIGGGANILPGVTIGEGAIVGAGSVVTRDVAPYSVVAGNPATRIRDVARQSSQK